MNAHSLSRHELLNYCNALLNATAIKDYCPNGLQVEGRETISKIVSGVTASQALVDKACDAGADVLLVHHGYFWRNEAAPIVGMKRRRIAQLLKHDVNLLAYHLPLDVHTELGNNAQLGKRLGLHALQSHAEGGIDHLLWQGQLPRAMEGSEFAEHLFAKLKRQPLHVAVDRPIQRVAWCTGGAQSYIDAAAALGVDAFISGEASESTTHSARELGLHYFGAGHHATERYGVQALGEHLAEHFSLSHTFIDIDNPV